MLQSTNFVKKKKKVGVVSQTLLVIFLLMLLFFTLFPVIITFLLSVKPNADYLTKSIWALPSSWQMSNYSSAFFSMLPAMLNTLWIDVVSTVAVALLSTFVAYVFSRKNFPGKSVLFMLIILPMLVPAVVSLTPQYLNIVNLGLMGSPLALILPYLAGNQIASIFLYRTFMGQQPAELYEAAQLDGAGNFRAYFSVCLPLTVPIMMVQSVAIFGAIYNDYLWPLMMFVGNRSHSTLMPLLTELASQVGQTARGASYALYLLSGIPLVFTTIVSLKFFINGEFAAGLKL